MVIGLVIYSLPLAVQPFQTAFRGVHKGMLDAALSLGMTKEQVFLLVILPLSKYGILPGETRVASIALYDETQKLNYAVAHSYAAVLLSVSFIMLFFITWLQRRTLLPRD
jgi:molybdate transport system permease protein